MPAPSSRPAQAAAAVSAGAQFLVSPGVTPALLHAHARRSTSRYFPGVATVGEVMAVLESGLDTMKFFPAGPAGGPDYLAAIGAPIPHVQFCPTGGISLATAPDYLELPNVSCVGGSWLTPRRGRQKRGLEQDYGTGPGGSRAERVGASCSPWPRRT